MSEQERVPPWFFTYASAVELSVKIRREEFWRLFRNARIAKWIARISKRFMWSQKPLMDRML